MTPAMDEAILTRLRMALAGLVRPSPGADLTKTLDDIETAAAALGAAADPRLRHYLDGRSYVKALNWLEGREAENARGRCG